MDNAKPPESKNNTQKKNPPISFKLDLSKCTNQQSEDDEPSSSQQFFLNQAPSEEHDEIPGLQHVKVTDDSFRQQY